MNVTPVNKFIIVERYHSAGKRRNDSPFISVSTSDNLGRVKFSNNETFSPGTVVYFGNKYERILMQGVEVLAMQEDNIVAISQDLE